MGSIMANGIRISYEEQGTGQAMVWAHGLGGTLHGWDETMGFFKDRHRVVAYDARGHGLSETPDRPEAYSQDIMVQDMHGVMDALNIEQAIIGGHSMGANVALNFAFHYPRRCLGLVLVGIGSGSSDAEWWSEWWNKLADIAEQDGMVAFMEEMKKLPAWESVLSHPQIGQEVIRTELKNSPKAIAHTIRGVQVKRPSIFQLQPELEKLAVKTLVVSSEFDTPVLECSRFMVQHLPEATLEIIPAKSHWTHLEAPAEFLQSVGRFVALLTA
jgi:pimeloyl-ACP methyl ester carboxylesterase